MGQASNDAEALRPGLVVGGNAKQSYRLLDLLGQGAAGQVWKAISNASELVALKFWQPQPNVLARESQPIVRDRFLHEGKNGMTLRHPHLLQIRDVVVRPHRPFLVMELAADTALTVARAAQRGGTFKVATEIAIAVAQAIVYLHNKGNVHRDIKPTNILKVDDRWVLGDFGIVRWNEVDPRLQRADSTDPNVRMFGSRDYMPPEQYRNAHTVGPTGDIYALGITWYELCEGSVPLPHAVGAGQLAIATPGPTKARMIAETSGPLRPIWDLAERAMAAAEAIVFVGYRIPPTDAATRAWMAEQLRGNGIVVQREADRERSHKGGGGAPIKQRLRLHTVLGPNVNHVDSQRLAGIVKALDPLDDMPIHQWPMGAEDFLGIVTRNRLLGLVG